MSFCIQPSYGWSCPIQVDKPLMRKSFCILAKDHSIPVVLTSQEHKGQTFLSIHQDNRPQLYIENKTCTTLFCAQALAQGKVADETQHFKWHCKLPSYRNFYYTMPFLSEKFPELPQDNFTEKICLASDPESKYLVQMRVYFLQIIYYTKITILYYHYFSNWICIVG